MTHLHLVYPSDKNKQIYGQEQTTAADISWPSFTVTLCSNMSGIWDWLLRPGNKNMAYILLRAVPWLSFSLDFSGRKKKSHKAHQQLHMWSVLFIVSQLKGSKYILLRAVSGCCWCKHCVRTRSGLSTSHMSNQELCNIPQALWESFRFTNQNLTSNKHKEGRSPLQGDWVQFWWWGVERSVWDQLDSQSTEVGPLHCSFTPSPSSALSQPK